MTELVTTGHLIAGNPDDWDKQTQINLMTPMRLTRMLLPGMKDKGQEWSYTHSPMTSSPAMCGPCPAISSSLEVLVMSAAAEACRGIVF